MASSINANQPRTNDKSNPAPEIRANFAAAKSEIEALQTTQGTQGTSITSLQNADSAQDTILDILWGDEAVATSGTPLAATHTHYKTTITSGGTAGNENYNLGVATAQKQGQRRLIYFGTRTDGSDVIVIDHANISHTGFTVTGVTLDAADEWILLEAQGATWEIIAAASGVVTES